MWELGRRLDRIDSHLGTIEDRFEVQFTGMEKNFDETISRLRHRDNNLDQRTVMNAERLNGQDRRIVALEQTVSKLIWGVIGALAIVLLEGALLVASWG